MSNMGDGAALEKPPPYPGGPLPSSPAYQNQNYGDHPPPYFPNPAPPPAGWFHGHQGGPPPPPNYGAYGQTVIITEPVTVPATQVIIVGGCPACRVGVLEDNFSCLGLLCAILFFPLGILCCLAMRDRRCTNCGAVF